MKLLLLFLLSLFSSLAQSYELSETKLKLLQDPNGAWVPIAVDTNFNSYLSELNLYEKQDDGSIISPIFITDKNGKQLNRVGWVRFGCTDDNLVDLGEFKNGTFEKNILLPENHLGHQIRYFFCPTLTEDNKTILVSSSFLDRNKKKYGWWGWNINDLEKIESSEKLLFRGTWYVIGIKNVSTRDEKIYTGGASKFEVNCTDKTVFSDQDNKRYNPNNDDAKHLRYLINTICRVNNILTDSDFSNIKKTSNPTETTKTTISSAINKKLSVDEAKVKCREIGFKEKTEKFGECVLELMK